MTQRYYGDMKVRSQGGSLIVTLPADAVDQLDMADGDFAGMYGDEGVLMLVPQNDDPGGDDDDEDLS